MEAKKKKKTARSQSLKPRLKKKPSDYPSLHLRPSEIDKNLIEKKIEALLQILNSNLKDDQLKFKKNDVAIEALKRGLELIEKEKSR